MRTPSATPLLLKAAVAALLTLAAAEVMAVAPPEDLMSSPECRQARDRFDAAFAAARDVKSAGNAALDDARRSAAIACFGRAGGGGAPGASTGLRAPQPAVVVPQTAATLKSTPGAASPPAAVNIQRPSTLGTCDPGGCWSTDGTRLNRVGPDLAGPRGVCMVQGTVATCP